MQQLSLNARAALLSVLLLISGLVVWEIAIPSQQAVGELTEYEKLSGVGAPRAGVPPPSQVIVKAWEELSDPFYDAGPNDKGIGIQIAYSIYRVLAGYLLAALIAIPLGFLIGMSPLAYKALNPFIQVLRPISQRISPRDDLASD
jgi:nitrate/nitrite transport system permease protein